MAQTVHYPPNWHYCANQHLPNQVQCLIVNPEHLPVAHQISYCTEGPRYPFPSGDGSDKGV